VQSGSNNTWSLKAQSQSLPFRLLLLAILFVVEKSLLNLFVDFASAQTAEGLGAVVRSAQHLVFRFLVTLAIAAALLAYVRAGNEWNKSLGPQLTAPIGVGWSIAHVLLLAVLIALSRDLYTPEVLFLSFAAAVGLWALVATAAMLAALRAIAPWPSWKRAAVGLGSIWIYAFIAGVASAAMMQWSERLWEPTARLTFYLVTRLLHPLIPTLAADPAALVLHAPNFAVQIAEVCSGLEGVGLMLVFCGAWLLFFRKEYRFPRAFLLVPIGLLLVFLLNVLRIAVFVLIGNAGYPDVAIYGFHSQAGWIGFNLAAALVLVMSRQVGWWQEPSTREKVTGDNATAAYLMPFLAVIAAGILARVLSSGFENWYGLRLIAGVVFLYAYRDRLLRQSWRFGAPAVLAGLMGFVIWLAAAHWVLPVRETPTALLALPPVSRLGWVIVRVLIAALLVPVVEELAFRGYLLRRIESVDFESVPYTAVRWPAIVVSAAIFGAAHGAMWLSGLLIGGLYGALIRKTGRIGDPIAAHAVTNALLAAYALWTREWQVW
jgi:exosortase E/protease (VPEID-CTERM system)